MLEFEINETGANPEFCVIWMHGLGADGHDFAPIVPELNLPQSPGIRFIFPHAPMQPVTINGGYVMRAWYDIIAPDLTAHQDRDGILQSADAINAIIEEQQQAGIPSQNIILAGFSQGGAMALHIGLRSGKPFAGVMALSCYMPLMGELEIPAASKTPKLEIFMAHGTSDPIVPITAGQLSKQALTEEGYSITWKDYPMEHSVCAEEIADISVWLKQVIGL